MRRAAMRSPARSPCSWRAAAVEGATTPRRRHPPARPPAGRSRPRATSRCGSASPSASSGWSRTPSRTSSSHTRTSRSRWSAGSPTTRSSPRSAAATRPTSRSRSRPTTPARSATPAAMDRPLSRTCPATRSTSRCSPGHPPVHEVQRHALRAAHARRRLRPLLQQRRAQAAGYVDPPKTMAELTRHGEEAHPEQLRRQRSRSSASTRL